MSNFLTEEELKILEEFFETTTPLPWKLVEGDKTLNVSGNTKYYPDKEFIYVDWDDCDQEESCANAGFIVHARRGLPKAVAEIRALRKEVAALKKAAR